MIGPDGNPIRGDRCRCSPLTGCGEWFNSTYAFNLHRIGKHGVSRRCLSRSEMLANGMSQNSAWLWISEKMVPDSGGGRQSGDRG